MVTDTYREAQVHTDVICVFYYLIKMVKYNENSVALELEGSSQHLKDPTTGP
jgi:hypothetical protein